MERRSRIWRKRLDGKYKGVIFDFPAPFNKLLREVTSMAMRRNVNCMKLLNDNLCIYVNYA